MTDDLLARCTFPTPGTTYTCAVSGGADSSALLFLACAAGLRVTAIHVDHGLRAGSAAEADIVHRLADRCGASFVAERAVVAAGPNLEARARDARRDVLPSDAATGHTADDQAETMLLNLLRGAGAGLSAMRPGHRHPLLSLRRHETAALCHAEGIDVVIDPTNDDLSFSRNRVRHDLLPQLTTLSSRDPVPVLVRQADLLRDDNDLLDALAGELDPTDARALTAAHPALARRAVRAWLRGDHPPDLASVDRVLAVARGESIACEVVGGRRVSRTGQRLRLH